MTFVSSVGDRDITGKRALISKDSPVTVVFQVEAIAHRDVQKVIRSPDSPEDETENAFPVQITEAEQAGSYHETALSIIAQATAIEAHSLHRSHKVMLDTATGNRPAHNDDHQTVITRPVVTATTDSIHKTTDQQTEAQIVAQQTTDDRFNNIYQEDRHGPQRRHASSKDSNFQETTFNHTAKRTIMTTYTPF
jgi:hypothetical protein